MSVSAAELVAQVIVGLLIAGVLELRSITKQFQDTVSADREKIYSVDATEEVKNEVLKNLKRCRNLFRQVAFSLTLLSVALCICVSAVMRNEPIGKPLTTVVILGILNGLLVTVEHPVTYLSGFMDGYFLSLQSHSLELSCVYSAESRTKLEWMRAYSWQALLAVGSVANFSVLVYVLF